MGVDLFGNGGFSLNWEAWRKMLELAEQFGWSPEGSIEMDYGELNWCHPSEEEAERAERKGYFSNDSQLVTDTDAAALAAALRRSLVCPSPPEDVGGLVSEFADYCAKSGFRIL